VAPNVPYYRPAGKDAWALFGMAGEGPRAEQIALLKEAAKVRGGESALTELLAHYDAEPVIDALADWIWNHGGRARNALAVMHQYSGGPSRAAIEALFAAHGEKVPRPIIDDL
jgi:hypothetical protein